MTRTKQINIKKIAQVEILSKGSYSECHIDRILDLSKMTFLMPEKIKLHLSKS